MNLKKIRIKNKRGDFPSLLIMLVVIIGISLASIIFAKVFLAITNELKDQPEFSNRTVSVIEVVEDNTIPFLDFFIFFALIAIMIGLIISSIYIDVHPAIVVVFIIALIVAVFLSGQLANIFSEVTSTSDLTDTASQFTYTNLILGSHFPIIILITGIIIIIVLYGKSRRVGEV